MKTQQSKRKWHVIGKCLICRKDIWAYGDWVIPMGYQANGEPNHTCRLNIASIPGVKVRLGITTDL